jgi:Zn-finger nucleic acid-binding protein
VDVCLGGCGGIWFDNFELQKLDDASEPAGEMLVKVKKSEDLQIDYSQRRNCPRCIDVVMMRHFYSPRRRVEVDECPGCGGYWLDAGELAAIREERQTSPEQQAAVEKYLNDIAAEILGPMRAGTTEQAARARQIDQLFRFTTPIRFQRETP